MHFQTYDFRSGCPDYFQSQDPSKIIGRVSNYADSDEFSNISDFKEQESDIIADFKRAENFSLRESYYEKSRVHLKKKTFISKKQQKGKNYIGIKQLSPTL